MSTTTSSRSPGAWDTHTPTFQHSRTSTTPVTRPPREPGSVGQNHPPLSFNASLSPHKQRFPPPSKHTRTPSPNYFGFQVDHVEGSSSSQFARAHWSPPSSNVRSAAATSPSAIPLGQNPEYEAFRKQSEVSAFSLGSLSENKRPSSHSSGRHGETHDQIPQQNRISLEGRENTPTNPQRTDNAVDNGHPPLQPVSRSPKRLLSSDSANITGRPRRNSPASFNDTDPISRLGATTTSATRELGSSLPPKEIRAPLALASHRGETLPLSLDDSSPSMITPQHMMNVLESAHEEVLILDLRVSTQFARSKISGALNLCIPTTLLKRPSFNVQKLAETFKDETERQKFERWRSSRYIIVYDAASTTLKDAITCVNTLKKFAADGWDGASYILKGGFEEFSKLFAQLVDFQGNSASAEPAKNIALDSRPEIAPVIGGCPMPATKSAANPFFGNIRQNMDLIGGVGQLPVHQPTGMTRQGFAELPTWLRQASDEKDDGKAVSDKFLQIEKREQKRMQEALSENVSYGSPSVKDAHKVQIAGIEKGSKNRYNNIWPFEHSRVKLQGIPAGGCDYINANHVQTEWCSKRYIATQGPIPATFSDFWSVIWDEDVRVMVMLTAEKEGGQIKAHRYWEDKKYGPLSLHFLSEHKASIEPSRIHRRKISQSTGQRRSTHPQNLSEQSTVSSDEPFITVRRFTLSHANHPFERMREITQLQYSTWPDFGAPAHPAHLLGLVEQCDAVVRATNGNATPGRRPVLVHCSAGCGRTGTFCAVDSVIDMMKRQKQWRSNVGAQHEVKATPMDIDQTQPPKHDSFFGSDAALAKEEQPGNWLDRDDIDLVEKTVEDFRLQRLSMVQSLRQFVLCYESILEWMVQGQQPRTA